jgi:hypothetical protein
MQAGKTRSESTLDVSSVPMPDWASAGVVRSRHAWRAHPRMRSISMKSLSRRRTTHGRHACA